MMEWLSDNWPMLVSSQGVIASVGVFLRKFWKSRVDARMHEAHTIVIATSDVNVAMNSVGVLQRNRVGPQGAAKVVVLYRKRWTCDALRKNHVDYIYRVEGYCSRSLEQWVVEISGDVFDRMVHENKAVV